MLHSCTVAKEGWPKGEEKGEGAAYLARILALAGGVSRFTLLLYRIPESLVREILSRSSGIEFPVYASQRHPGRFRAGLVERSNVMWRLRLCILFFRKSLKFLQHHPSSNSPSDLA